MRTLMLILIMTSAVQDTTTRWLHALRIARNLLVAPEVTRALQSIPFDPDDGFLNRRSYQDLYGIRGQHLVEVFGEGFDRQYLVKIGAVSVAMMIAPPCLGLSPISLLRQVIRDNLSGRQENFQDVSWKFDPDIAQRRSVEFQEKYGVRGERLIARLGQGNDGYLEEGKLQQIIRDQEIDSRLNKNVKTR